MNTKTKFEIVGKVGAFCIGYNIGKCTKTAFQGCGGFERAIGTIGMYALALTSGGMFNSVVEKIGESFGDESDKTEE